MIRHLIPAALCVAALEVLTSSPAAAQRIDVCTRIYQPVCAMKRNGRPDTFGNACEARAARARVLYDGRCRTACPRIYAPVCAKAPGRPRMTYSNACVARSEGARPVYGGPCRSGR